MTEARKRTLARANFAASMKCLVAVLLSYLSLTSVAQVVNIENKRFDNDTARWSAQAGFRFNVVENTQRSLDLGLNGGVQFIHDIHRVFLVTDFTLNKVERNDFTNTGFQHVRYQRQWRGPFSWEGYTQMQYNKPLRIDLRWVTGAGMRAVVRNADDLRLALGSSVMYEHEVDRVNELRYNDIRSSNYVSAAWKLEPHVQVTTIFYYQPLIGDASDHRMAVEAQLRLRVNRRFAFDSRMNLQKDTKMAPGVPELNYRWSNVFSFVW